MLNGLALDLAELFHADNLKQCWPRSDWEVAPRRAHEIVPRLLFAQTAILGWPLVVVTWYTFEAHKAGVRAQRMPEARIRQVEGIEGQVYAYRFD